MAEKHRQLRYFLGRRYDVQLAFDLAARAFDFRVAGVADQDNVVVAVGVTAALLVDSLDQRTCGVDHIKLAAGRIAFNLARYAVCAKYRDGTGRNLVDFIDEDSTARA
jgi:hypothetical protein